MQLSLKRSALGICIVFLLASCSNSNDTVSPVGHNSGNIPPVSGEWPLGISSDLTARPTIYQPSDNWWNLNVSSAPVDPNSATIISRIKSFESTGGRLHPDFTPNYGIPYCVVSGDTPLVPVDFSYASESDKGAPGRPSGYPIPAAAKTNPYYLENAGGSDGDRHMLIIDRDNMLLFELSYANWNGSQWTAGAGAVFDLMKNGRRPEGYTSTDAAGLAVLPGLVRPDEAFGSEPIRHALRCSLKQINGYVWPASHIGSTDAGAPPLGMRLRLKKSVDISGYTPEVQRIFQAMKTYGLIVADRGGNMYVQGVMDSRWDNSVLNPAFHSLHVTDFDIIQLGWGKSLTTVD
ncbi:MAG TPA: hypothetical protein VFH88_11700 [Candidatus Krumholzibacteria bacterium]|nr:hypothetical protein [Candidatus Krumholzibacteria bacterium]